jgi:hypothetical protein
MRWAGHVALMGDMRNAYKIFVRKPKGTRLLGRPRHRWVIILEWIIEEYGGKLWTGFIRLSTGSSQ